MSTNDTTAEHSRPAPELEQPTPELKSEKLGLFAVIMPGVAQISPGGSLFFVAAAMASLAGASVPLIFLVSMIGMIATSVSLALFSSIWPSAGSFVTYTARAIGVRTATAIGAITVIGYVILFGGLYIYIGSYIVHNFLGDPHVTGITQIVTVVYGAAIVVPVILGLRFGMRATIALFLFEAAIVIGLAIAVLGRGGTGGLSAEPFHWPHGSGATNILSVFSLAFLAFAGFEAAAPLAEEADRPRRNVPIALLSSVIISGLLYIFGSYALVTAFGMHNINGLATDSNPFHTAAKQFFPLLAPLVNIMFLSSMTSGLIAASTQTSRVIFAGARGGLWPHKLSTLSRFGTPAVAAIAFVVPSVLIGVASTLFASPVDASGLLTTFGTVGAVCMYLAANVALVVQWFRLRRTGVRKNPLLWVATPIIGIAVLAIAIWGDLRPGQPSPYNTLPWLTIALIVFGIAYTAILGAVRPHVLKSAPTLLEGPSASNAGAEAVSA